MSNLSYILQVVGADYLLKDSLGRVLCVLEAKREDLDPYDALVKKIVKGNSGGPVLDSDNRVVGIAVRGAEDMVSAVIPINALKHLEKQ